MHRAVIASVTFIGLVSVAVLAYVVVLGGPADRAATMAPATTVAYANVYLQPSTGQQLNLASLIGRLPGFADSASLDEKVDQIITTILGESGIDYATDVKPWLGDQLAVAGWPSADDAAEPAFTLIADVKDLAAAQASLPNLLVGDGQAPRTETYRGTDITIAGVTAYAFLDDTVEVPRFHEPAVALPALGLRRAIVGGQGGNENQAQHALRCLAHDLEGGKAAHGVGDQVESRGRGIQQAASHAGDAVVLAVIGEDEIVVRRQRDGLRCPDSFCEQLARGEHDAGAHRFVTHVRRL